MLSRVAVRRFNALPEKSVGSGKPIVALVASIAVGIAGYFFSTGDEEKPEGSDATISKASTESKASLSDFVKKETGIDDPKWVKENLGS
jgi:hypothetical protein